MRYSVVLGRVHRHASSGAPIGKTPSELGQIIKVATQLALDIRPTFLDMVQSTTASYLLCHAEAKPAASQLEHSFGQPWQNIFQKIMMTLSTLSVR
jgi:hypothetical protein